MNQKGLLQTVIIFTIIGLIITGIVGYFVFSQRSISQVPPSLGQQAGHHKIVSGYVADQAKCATQPKLTIDEVVVIAQKSKLSKQLSGWWAVTYSRGSSWRTNPFSDECIWVVRSHAMAPTGSDFGSYALDVTYIRDSSGEFYYYK